MDQLSQSYLEKGNTAFKSCDYQKAIELYTFSISLNSMDSMCYNNRAAAFIQMHNYQSAYSDCVQAIHINPTNQKAVYRAGVCCFQMGEFKESIEYFTKANTLDFMNIDYKQKMTEAHYLWVAEENYKKAFKSNNMQRAREMMNVITSYCAASKWIIKDIKLYIRNGESDQAANKINICHSLSTDDRITLLALLKYQNGASDQAKKILTEAMKQGANTKRLEKMLTRIKRVEHLKEEANNAFKIKDYDNAISLYTKILEKERHNRSVGPIIYTNRAISYLKKKQIELSLKDLEKALSVNPKYGKASFKQGEILLSIGQPHRARKAFENAKINGIEFDVGDKIKECENEESKQRQKQYYDILGLSIYANEEEIKTTYKKLALQYHPDKQINKTTDEKERNEQKFKQISMAYDKLCYPEKYKENYTNQESMFMFNNVNPFDLFSQLFSLNNFKGSANDGRNRDAMHILNECLSANPFDTKQ